MTWVRLGSGLGGGGRTGMTQKTAREWVTGIAEARGMFRVAEANPDAPSRARCDHALPTEWMERLNDTSD